ncbi:cysteine--tRNA ligase [Blattabacterium cuenoti]|uniref:cysteine--tRNA ligase n=1 Tax=Blattabacterium cuenoti TaxID=1653831 RepID=UPI00163BF86A|nr:cysteine--tRNA ligase [Blattabacterium cuenoti]
MEYKEIAKKNLKIYNSLTGKKEFFNPIHKNNIGIYVCGPTVYNHLHLGNCRTFIFFDIVFRYFKHLGYKVRYVRNITDVGHLENNGQHNEEDKIYNRSKIEGLEPMEIVQKYTISFHNLLNILNLLPPSIEPTATGHIVEQVDMVKSLIQKKSAYEMNGSVYFDLKKYNKNYSYGVLSHNNLNQLINKNFNFSSEKHYFQDFSIWKKVGSNHIMSWNSPWGKGVPGWHTECTVMSTKYLGKNFDIHGGGIDLKFPHHECEIAQFRSFYETDSILANYWMHTNMLTLNGKKMSKSTGNFLDLQNILMIKKDNYFSNIIKFFILQSHYRNILNFSEKGLLDSEKGFKKIICSIKILNNFCEKESLKKQTNNNTNTKSFTLFNVSDWINSCYKAINDDFNIPLLISLLFEVTNIIINDPKKIEDSWIFLLKKYMNYFFFDILGFINNNEVNISIEKSKKFEILVKGLIKLRKEAREKKNWIISDIIRKELHNIGIFLHDKKINKSKLD